MEFRDLIGSRGMLFIHCKKRIIVSRGLGFPFPLTIQGNKRSGRRKAHTSEVSKACTVQSKLASRVINKRTKTIENQIGI